MRSELTEFLLFDFLCPFLDCLLFFTNLYQVIAINDGIYKLYQITFLYFNGLLYNFFAIEVTHRENDNNIREI
jgi:hypothetical protein